MWALVQCALKGVPLSCPCSWNIAPGWRPLGPPVPQLSEVPDVPTAQPPSQPASPVSPVWLDCTLGKSLYKFPGKETRHELFPAPMLVSDWCETIENCVWSSVWKWKFATSVETFPDLILEMLYKAIKNKKVKVESPDNAEKDETTQTSNTRNSKC